MRHRGSTERDLITGLFAFAFLLGIGYVIWLSITAVANVAAPSSPETAMSAPARATRTPRPTRTPRQAPTDSPASPRRHVGIVAGHWQNDSGATCADGLEEVSINLEVASQVVAILQANGIAAELLPEFSNRLEGYQADAFVSIHADSCEFPGLSGFKVARVASSAIPAEEDRLVQCLIQAYSQTTGLAFDEDTITFDMTEYHAFWEISATTPGAIIEAGFMQADRDLLTNHSDLVASGIARGILCFLSGE